jgi:hypothetical protein
MNLLSGIHATKLARRQLFETRELRGTIGRFGARGSGTARISRIYKKLKARLIFDVL